jgi:hypothetical protein
LSEAHAREIEALKQVSKHMLLFSSSQLSPEQKYTEDLQKSAERIEAETKKVGGFLYKSISTFLLFVL